MKQISLLVATSAITLALTGCGGSGSSGSGSNNNSGDTSASVDTQPKAVVTIDETTGIKSVAINASDYENYVYINLETGEAVDIDAAEASTSTEWHMGIRRYTAILNGGASGAGTTAGALAAEQEDFYDAGEPDNNVFLNATPASEEEHLLASYDLDTLTFEEDSPSASIQGSGDVSGTMMDLGWYNYNLATHALSVNDDNWWLLRSHDGNSYAKFHASALTYDRTTGLDVTFEFDVQPSGASTFNSSATFNGLIPADGGESCFDFDTDSTVDCSETTWDLKLEIVGRNWNLWTNGGISGNGVGATFGPLPTDTADEYTNGTNAPAGNVIVSHYVQDKNAGIFEANPWYEYNLTEQHQLWPNFRVYVVDTNPADADAKKFAVQITSYYSNTGVGGHPTIRIIEL